MAEHMELLDGITRIKFHHNECISDDFLSKYYDKQVDKFLAANQPKGQKNTRKSLDYSFVTSEAERSRTRRHRNVSIDFPAVQNMIGCSAWI